MKATILKVKKDDRIRVTLDDGRVIEIHVKGLGQNTAKLCILREGENTLKHVKSEKQA